ncbi:hypothetical protein [Nocardioides pacificus]
MDLRIGRSTVALLCASFILAAAAGLSLLMAPDSTVTGKVTGFGFTGDGRCYPTVEYVVDGETYRTTPRKHERWCVYDPADAAKTPQVYVSSGSPEDGRLSKYGEAPKWLAVGALAAFFAGVLAAATQIQNGRLQNARSLGSTG